MVIFKHGAPRGTVSSQGESILSEAEAEVMERGAGTGDLISLAGLKRTTLLPTVLVMLRGSSAVRGKHKINGCLRWID